MTQLAAGQDELREIKSKAGAAINLVASPGQIQAAVAKPIRISSLFDSGNVRVVNWNSPGDVNLEIVEEPYCESDGRAHFQWYNFSVMGAKGRDLRMNIVNAGKCSFPDAWAGYHSCASYDLERWFRVPTTYDAARGVLTITHSPERDVVRYAYFAPYTLDRHQQLIHKMQVQLGVTLHHIGQTVQRRPMELLQIGEEQQEKKKIWFIARQHPGESMAEWFIEGLLERLVDPRDAVARHLLRSSTFYVIPNMNPDGSILGHLRTNAAGANLNREWAQPSESRSPEVLCTKQMMEKVGVDLLVDVHGDEALPYNFIAGNEGIPSYNGRLASLEAAFSQALKKACPDFQTKYGYPKSAPGRANLSLCSKAVGEQFKCLSLTLEMPFKDTADYPEPHQGWSPERSIRFGEDILQAVWEVLPQL